MRYGIFSDIHSNGEALEAVINAFKEEDIDSYLCVGDLVGYAANPDACIEKAFQLTNIIVAGNHDWAAVNLVSMDYFNPLAAKALSWTKRSLNEKNRLHLKGLRLVYRNKDLTLVHGTLNNPAQFHYLLNTYDAKETFRLMDTAVCFVGHTHVAGVFVEDSRREVRYQESNFIRMAPKNKYVVNVGSVGQPRDGNPQASYCIYDTLKKEAVIRRVDYNREAARKKILDAGLPRFLGDRLLAGR